MNASSEQNKLLYPLLDFLSQLEQPSNCNWQNWKIIKIIGGLNNLIYRAIGPIGDFAIKFTVRDNRNRANREYRALSAIQNSGLTLAPKPILLEYQRYDRPVIVQSWLDGKIMTTSPESDLEWKALLKHYSLFHKISPETTKIELSSAVTDMRNIKTGQEMIQQQMDCMPYETQPEFIRSLLKSFENKFSLEDKNVTLSLCRGDANHLNFIKQPDGIASVDWENSGWSDPSFEIAELIAHPCYIKVPFSRKEWIIDMYCKLINNQEVACRIHIFYRLMLVWWVARLARCFYEVSQGIDQRFENQTSEWRLKLQLQYDHYVNLVEKLV